ncbi:MAG: hypothetical protein ACR2OJ_14915 [Hyphomicrobiales bacterium]
MKTLAAILTVAISTCAFAISAQAAGPEYIPQGHVYSPNSNSLPPSQSRQAEIERRADELQVQRYNRELRQRRSFEYMNLNRFDFGNPNNTLDNW